MKQRILDDLKMAMKSQDKDVLAVIRMVKGAIILEEKNKKRELSDDEIITIVNKQIKTRNESIESFKKANRTDLITQTEKEIEILNKYTPEQLDEEEIIKMIDEMFEKEKPNGITDMGKMMRNAKELFNNRADMSLVSSIIREKLNTK